MVVVVVVQTYQSANRLFLYCIFLVLQNTYEAVRMMSVMALL